MKMPEMKIKLVHLQLTRRCNLRCPYCAQWKDGSNGKNELDLAAWKNAVASILEFCRMQDRNPQFVLWGGEPLIFKGLEELLEQMRDLELDIGIVTNGSLIGNFADTINDCVKTLYISIDGHGDVHDKSRGKEGLYRRIGDGLSKIDKRRVKAVGLCTINRLNIRRLAEIPEYLAPLGLAKVIFQNIIFVSSSDAKKHIEWLASQFGACSSLPQKWVSKPGDFDEIIRTLPAAMDEIRRKSEKKAYPMDVCFFPDEINSSNVADWFSETGLTPEKREYEFCLAPFRHLSVRSDGGVHHCVDFDDLCLGNIEDEKLGDIFSRRESVIFRKDVCAGRNPLCRRCPWSFNTKYELD